MKTRYVMMFLLLGLGSCGSDEGGSRPFVDYSTDNPISVSAVEQNYNISTYDPAGMNADAKRDVQQFLIYASEAGGKNVTVRVPQGGSNYVAVGSVVNQLKTLIDDVGLERNNYTFENYVPAYGDPNPGVLVTASGYQANTRSCGSYDDALTSDFTNRRTRNFGCSYQNNIAAMIDNPRDFVEPRRPSYSNGRRNLGVVSSYYSRSIQGSSAASTK